jgi:drug/metabolite transporter (DMT)-like permease
MSLEPLPLVLVLLSALMHASWNALVKLGNDRLLTLMLVKGPGMVVAAAAFLVVDLPSVESLPYLLGSTAVTGFYFYFLVKAYHIGDLSLAYPMARGLAPLLVLAIATVAVGEIPTGAGLAGIMVVCPGILALGWQRGATRQHYVALFWASGVGLCVAAYTVLDGIGGRVSGSPFGYTAALNILSGILLCGAVVYWRRGAIFNASRREWAKGFLGGALMFGSYAIVIYALTLAPIAHVAALRETSVIFGALLGTLLLRERFGAKRVVASLTVAAGIVLLVVAG